MSKEITKKDIFWMVFVACALVFGFAMRRYYKGKHQRALELIRKKYDLPALGVGFVDRYGEKEIHVVGEQKYGSGVPVQRDDCFHIGSCTKLMTAALFATFVEEGLISFDTQLKDVFPELAIHSLLKRVTMEKLLCHRSGIASDFSMEELFDIVSMTEDVVEQREIITQRILRMKPASLSYQENLYSNNGYILLGAVLEKISGESWETLIRWRIFNPLGMKTAGFGAAAKGCDKICQPWHHAEKHGKPYPIDQNNTFEQYKEGYVSDNPAFYGPAGTVHCSIYDLLLFLEDQFRGYKHGKGKLFSQKMYQDLFDASQDSFSCGGWKKLDDDLFNFSGSNNYNYMLIMFTPQHRFGAVSVTNFAGFYSCRGFDATSEALTTILNTVKYSM